MCRYPATAAAIFGRGEVTHLSPAAAAIIGRGEVTHLPPAAAANLIEGERIHTLVPSMQRGREGPPPAASAQPYHHYPNITNQ